MRELVQTSYQHSNYWFFLGKHPPIVEQIVQEALIGEISGFSFRIVKICSNKHMMVEEEALPIHDEAVQEIESKKGFSDFVCMPWHWFKMLAKEMHWSFVLGVVVVYGISQGFGGALARVGTEYYMKDVQQVQPSESQIYQGITSIPWIIKPLWGILTDVLPICGYHRRPYFIFAGVLGVISMLFISVQENLHIVLALLSLTAGSAGVAIADVTVDACVAQNSGIHPLLAADMQSLCALSVSIGALVGFSLSGSFVHLIGPKGVFGLLAIPAGLVVLVGIFLKELHMPDHVSRQVCHKFRYAANSMLQTLKCPDVWRPCLYMYISLSLSLNIYEGMFYWLTDAKDGPSFSKEAIGYTFSIGQVGALLGALLYQYSLKEHSFRDLVFWTQLLFSLSGMLDLVLVLRLNLKIGVPDYFFVAIDESVSRMTARLKWMPLLVLSSKLCPRGIEGTLFALLMSIDNFGLLSSSWLGGLLLHILKVTRTEFDNLWLAILIRNILRVAPLGLLFLLPKGHSSFSIIPNDALETKESSATTNDNVELVTLVNNVDGR